MLRASAPLIGALGADETLSMLKWSGVVISFILATFSLWMFLDTLGINGGGGVQLASLYVVISIASIAGSILLVLDKSFGAYLAAGAWLLVWLGGFGVFDSNGLFEFGFAYPIVILGFSAMVFMLVVAVALQDNGRS